MEKTIHMTNVITVSETDAVISAFHNPYSWLHSEVVLVVQGSIQKIVCINHSSVAQMVCRGQT